MKYKVLKPIKANKKFHLPGAVIDIKDSPKHVALGFLAPMDEKPEPKKEPAREPEKVKEKSGGIK
jgi:hypothetical protein